MNTKLIITAALSLSLIGGVGLAEAGQRRGGGRSGSSGTTVGRAVPRGTAPSVVGPRGVVPGAGGLYRPYFYGPRFGVGFYGGYPYGYYPYGLGFGFGYPYGYGYSYGYGYYPYGYGYPAGYVAAGYAGTSYGGVRITDAPEDAAVYADGYYVGAVGDFNGTFRHLNLEAGPHHIEIMPPQGGQTASPMSVDVNVRPGQTITYRANP